MAKRGLCAGVFSILFLVLNSLSASADVGVASKLSVLIKKRAPKQSGVSVVDLATGSQVFSHKSNVPLKPASVLKLVTTAAALKQLGPDYHFKTRVYVDKHSKSFFKDGRVEELYLMGGGDPTLTIEDLWIIARHVKARGVRKIGQIVLDRQSFAAERIRGGQRAYEAGSSALSFNYNSVQLSVCPTAVGEPALVFAEPAELGVRITGSVRTVSGSGLSVKLDEMAEGPKSNPNAIRYRSGGSIGVNKQCVSFYRSIADPARYAGVVFSEILKILGVNVVAPPTLAYVPEGAKELYAHESKALSQILEDLNHYSSNFIAEQVLTVLGRRSEDRYDRTHGVSRLHHFLRESGYAENQYQIMDGSGLSHANRITAGVLTGVMLAMYRDSSIGVEFEKSLSVGGRSGTLEKRSFDPDRYVVRAKTGTLNGVTSLAGFVRSRTGRKFAFAILLNGVANRNSAHRLEQEIVETLYKSS